ncbi:ABC transporter substrate-binding protein [Acidothermaceae bacterium B102]|nr:ABC transporter substrate-binding protein [Acidothermaceae bacterium B102]
MTITVEPRVSYAFPVPDLSDAALAEVTAEIARYAGEYDRTAEIPWKASSPTTESSEGRQMNVIRRTGATARRRTSRQSAAVATVAALSLAAVAGCSSGSKSSAAGSSTSAAGSTTSSAASGSGGATPVSGGTLNVSFWADNVNLLCVDPFQTYWIEHRSEIRNFTDSLTDQDPSTGKVIPHLAASWSISTDGKAYTFKLRSGVTFSDGTAFDAAAVLANVNGWLATKTAVPGAFGDSYIANLAGAKVIDPSTVEIDLSAPNSSFLQATATTNLAILAPSAWKVAPAQRCLGTGLIGTGPFVLSKYTPNVGLVLKKRAGYAWASSVQANQGAAYLDEIDFHYVKDDSVRTGNLLNGTTDIAWPRNPFSIQQLAQIKDKGDTIETRSLPGVSYPYFANTTAGRPLADPAVRQAIYKATDLKTIATTLHGADYPVAAGVFDSTTPYFTSQSAKLGFDLDGAKKALDAADWKVGSDGIRAKDGKKLTLIAPQAGVAAPGVELWQSELQAAGIDLQTPIVQQSQLFTILADPTKWDLYGSYLTRADPGALRSIVLPGYATVPALASALTATDATAATQILALFTKATDTTDLSVAADSYGQLQDLLVDQGLVFPLLERVQYAGVSTKVHGFAFTDEAFLSANSIWISK